jgi:predicted signal transduction protein with EAL and GGDEF domain
VLITAAISSGHGADLVGTVYAAPMRLALPVSVSVGIDLSKGDIARPPDLLRDAETALYQAKGTIGRYEVFRPSMHTRTLKRLKLEEDLRRGIDRGGFEVHYQPHVTLDTSTIAEMEALVRWGHPRHGLVMPSEFIQVSEETGLIVPIGERVLEEACRRATQWGYQNGHSPSITMCVNLSVRQLQDPDQVDKVERALRRAALDANELNLEITETAVMEDEQHVISVLRDLRFRSTNSPRRFRQRLLVAALREGSSGGRLDDRQVIYRRSW